MTGDALARGIFPNPIPERIPGQWMVTSYRGAEALLRADWNGFELEPGRPGMRFHHIPEGMTPQKVHRQRRGEVQRAHFSLRRIETHAREVCRHEAVSTIAHLKNSGGDFQVGALEYAWSVGSVLLGIDGVTSAEMLRRVADFRFVTGRVWPDPETAAPVAEGLMELMEPSLLRRREFPKDDLFSTIVASGRDLQELRHEAFGWFMVAAMNSACSIARTAFLLHSFPEYRILDQDALEAAFDETLRLMPVVSYITRRSTKKQVLLGVEIGEGEIVIMDVWEANRDPQIFGDTATNFRPGRVPVAKAPRWGLGFGAGPRSCIGEHLAREETVVLLSEAYRNGMELAGPWEPSPPPFPLFVPAPVSFRRG